MLIFSASYFFANSNFDKSHIDRVRVQSTLHLYGLSGLTIHKPELDVKATKIFGMDLKETLLLLQQMLLIAKL